MHEFRRKILIRAIALTCVVLVFATFFILFKKNIEHQMAFIETLKSRKVVFSQSASGILALKKEWEIAEQYKTAIGEYASTKDDLVLIPQQIKSLAAKHKMTVSFVYGEEVQKDQASGAQTVQFTMSIEGQESGVYDFLAEFDDIFHTINADTLDITKVQAGMRVSITGKVQYY